MAVRLAVVGVGEWGGNHIRVSKELGVLSKMCDLDETKLKHFRSLYGVDYTNSFKEIVDDKAIDAVTLVVPASLHYRMARQLIEAGKHVLIEKPICTRTSDARKLIRLADKRGTIICVGHIFRYNSGLRHLKTMIKRGDFGDIHLIISRRMGLRTPRPDCGVIMDFAIHDVDIARFLMADKKSKVVSVVKSNPLGRKYEDYGNLVLSFGHTLANISVSWLTPTKVRDLMVVGSRKSAILDYSTQELMVFNQGILPKYSSFGEFTLIRKEGDIHIPRIKFEEPLKLEVQDFLSCIGSGKKPVASAEVGLRALEVIEEVYKVARGG
jgi:predicted dehydrogenase